MLIVKIEILLSKEGGMLVKLRYDHLQKLFDLHLTERCTEKDQHLKGPRNMIKKKKTNHAVVI